MPISKYRFMDIFQENPDGTLAPKITINVNGVVVAPGAIIGLGTKLGGIDFHQYKYLDVAGEYIGDIFFIRGFFRQL